MSEYTTHPSINQQLPENNLTENTFVRCPHDKENPYVMINRNLTRNSDLSFQARGFLFYLLSNIDSWSINREYIMRTQNVGKDKLKSMIDELIEAGYISMQRITTREGHRPVKYLVSEFPRFKENIPQAENPHVENAHVGNPGTKEVTKEKERIKEEERNARSEGSLAKTASIQFNKKTNILEDIPIEELKILYPNIDIPLQIKKMEKWLIENPKKQKKNYNRFVSNWLSTEAKETIHSKSPSLSHQHKNSLFVEECRQDSPEAFLSIRVFGKFVVNQDTKQDLFLGIDPATFSTAFLKLAGVEENG